MELALLIYFISIIHPLENLIMCIVMLMFVSVVVLSIVWLANFEEPKYIDIDELEKKRELIISVKQRLKKLLSWILILDLINIAIPSERTAYMMLGAYAAQTVAQSEQMDKVLSESSKISNKILTIVNNKLDTYVDDTIKEVDKVASK